MKAALALIGVLAAASAEAAAQRLQQATAGGVVNGRTLVVVTAFNETITCAATYSNYRRFETSARIVPPK